MRAVADGFNDKPTNALEKAKNLIEFLGARNMREKQRSAEEFADPATRIGAGGPFVSVGNDLARGFWSTGSTALANHSPIGIWL